MIWKHNSTLILQITNIRKTNMKNTKILARLLTQRMPIQIKRVIPYLFEGVEAVCGDEDSLKTY